MDGGHGESAVHQERMRKALLQHAVLVDVHHGLATQRVDCPVPEFGEEYPVLSIEDVLCLAIAGPDAVAQGVLNGWGLPQVALRCETVLAVFY